MKKEDDITSDDMRCINCSHCFQKDGEEAWRCDQRGGKEDEVIKSPGKEHCSLWDFRGERRKVEKKKKPKKKPQKEAPSYTTLVIDNYIQNVEKFYQIQPFFYDKGGLFWFWRDNLYVQVDEVDVMNMLDDKLGFLGQTVNSKLKSQYIEAFKRVGRKKIPEEAPKKWVQFDDKAYSLKSGNVYEVKPNYFFTNPIPWEMGETDNTPIMDKLIKEWVGEKYMQTAYEIIAYCCYTDYPIHLIFCLVGCGRNGKSKFMGLINKFLGQDNITSSELDVLIDSRFESFKLYRKLVCTMGETNFGVISKTSLIKKLTGQDLIGFEYKHKKPFDDKNYAKIIISSNSLPPSNDTSEGFYRRWLILDFPNVFPEGRDVLQDIPDSEYNNLAKKVTKILPKLLERGTFTNQGTIEERQQRYILASNPLSLFLKMFCRKKFDSYLRYSELYMAYRKFLHLIKHRKINTREFNDVLAIEGLEIARTTKKINNEYVNGKFVEGVEFMNIMNDMQQNITNSPYRKLVVKSCIPFIKFIKNLADQYKNEENVEINEIEELFEPHHIPCAICGENPTKYCYRGRYFCCKAHVDAYKAQERL